jgi:putative transposase
VTPSGGKTWFTAAEIAELALPGLPKVKRKINDRAAAEDWCLRVDSAGLPLARKRNAQGGGWEYHLSVLPAAARVALAQRGFGDTATVSDESPASSLWNWFAQQPDAVKDEARRRADVVAAIELLEASGLTRSAAVACVSAERAIGASTLWSWLKLIAGIESGDRLPNLAPRRTGGGAEAPVDDDVWQFLKSDYLRASKPTWESCYRRAVDYAAERGVEIPHARTLWRKFEREVPPQVVTLRRKGVEALRKMLPPQIRSVAELHAMELVNIDGHRVDVFVRWPDGTIGRPMCVAIQDVYSRKFLAERIGRDEDTLTARLAFADLFQRYGIPKGLLADNGRAFASKWLSGGAKSRFRFKIRDEEPTGLLTALGITIHWATPYRGQSKPIERGFRDFCDAIAKHPAFEGAYTGNSPLAKPENYGSRAVDLAVFMQVWRAGIAAHNRRTGRRTEMAGGRGSFDEVFAASYATSPIGKATDEQLRMALLAADQVSADRQNGSVTIAGNRYWTIELSQLAGQKVTVRFDPEDLTKPVHVYDRAGRFLVTAPMWERTGFLDMQAAKDRSKLESNWRKAARAAEKAEALLSADQLVARLPEYSDEDAPASPPVIRPVRHRGQTAAALKPVAEAPQPQLIDRIEAAARLRLVAD